MANQRLVNGELMPQRKKYIGLDIGASGIKVSVMVREGKACRLEGCHFLDTSSEGILNESEYYALVSDWIQKNGWGKCPTCISIPQYLVTCTERDFPACPPEKVPELVAFETRQVAGLSEEAMTYDYVSLPAGLDRSNPVLIGIGREQLIRERLGIYERNNIRCDFLGIGGVAVVNAFFDLHPEALTSQEPVLLLDLGKENSTAIVIAAGQPLFTGSLMFAGDKFESACVGRGALGPSSMEEIVLSDEIGRSQVMTVAGYLEDELHGALETWRAQENGDTAKLIVRKVYLCGGVSRIRGLDTWLQERLETPVELTGPVVEGMVLPEQMLSYGLSLQAAQKAEIPISLLPPDVKSRLLRMRLWPLMALALAVVALFAAIMEIRWFVRMDEMEEMRLEELNGLESCNAMIEEIKKKRSELYASEANLVPFIAPGNELGNMMKALTAIGQSAKGRSWLIYLADEGSYLGTRNLQSEANANVTNGQKNAPMFGGGATSGSLDAKESEPEFPIRLTPPEVHGISRLVAFGYYAMNPQEPFKYVRELSDDLSNSGVFEHVDFLSNQQKAIREDIFKKWDPFRRKNATFQPYAFLLPLKDKGIDGEVVSEYVEEQLRLKTKGKKKKK